MFLQKIRDRAQGWFAYTIIGLLIVPFAVWGINYYFEGGGPMDAAVVGDSTISVQEFQRTYQQQRQRMQAMFGGNADPALLDGPRLKQQVLQQLIEERVLTQLAREQGLRIGDRQLHDAIVTLPVFQQNGRFDKELYDRWLRNQGYVAATFEESFRQGQATEQLRDGLTASALFTPVELERLIALLKQQRELQYTVLSLADYVAKATVDDAKIQDYFAKHQDRFVNPEQAQVQFIELKLAQLAEGIAISEADLKTAYQDQIAKYGQPEERSASHLLVKLPQNPSPEEVTRAQVRAKQIADDLHAGTKTFDQALQDAKNDPSGALEGGELGVIGKGMFEDPAFENALFALQQSGDVSEPVRMPSGFHIIRLDGVTPSQTKPFAEVRDSIAQELRQQQAENRFYEITQTLANLSYEHPDSLEPAAKALDAPIQDSGWFSRQGAEGIAAYPKLIEGAFSEEVLKRGINSEPLELAPGHVVAIRLKDYRPATPRPLEESREEIGKILREQQARELLIKDAEALKARAAKGEPLQTLAKELGGTYQNAGLVTRDAPTVDRAVLTTAFRLPQPETGQVALGSTALANGDRAVLEVVRVIPGQTDALSEAERKAMAQQVAQQSGSGQFGGLLESLRVKTKVVTYGDRL